ncbi:MAG: histidine ammonia-lyase [Myxococcaceae bacterium]|nr:histidine ammonia-lyase [Myxococcaceae bacterium]
MPVAIDGNSLTLKQLRAVATASEKVSLAPSAAKAVDLARTLVERLADADAPTYGINTGFGTLAEVRIEKKDLKTLQRNLILSHAVGVGNPMSVPEARAMLLLRANVLAKGNSGVRRSTLDLLLEMLNRGVTPVIPERGSVGASGDLAPLAHLTLVVIGEGEAFVEGQRLPGRAALERVGLKAIELEAKEGLTLVNGTQAMCSVGGLALLKALDLAELFDVAGAMTVEGLLGSHKPFSPEVHVVRPHDGQRRVAEHLRALLEASALVESHANCAKVQDPYSLRCIPQVHGAALDGLNFCRRTLEVELNAATDNPLVFTDTGKVISAGNFHGQPISLALDVLAMSLTQLMSISERRVEQLVNPALSGLPAFLAPDSGLNSGFMIAQVTAAALVVESRVLSHPASVDSIPSSAGREDHVSMGMTAALKGRAVTDHATHGLAIELLCAAQALDFRAPVKPGRGVLAAHEVIRKAIPHHDKDRELHRDVQAMVRLIESGELLGAVRRACYEPAP